MYLYNELTVAILLVSNVHSGKLDIPPKTRTLKSSMVTPILTTSIVPTTPVSLNVYSGAPNITMTTAAKIGVGKGDTAHYM